MGIHSFYSALPPVILASASPRRADLLRGMGVGFRVQRADVDERAIASRTCVEELPCILSRAKASSVFDSLLDHERDVLVVGADTVVSLDGKEVDKPSSYKEAYESLLRLSGRSHLVRSGVTLLGRGCDISFDALSVVHFADLSHAEIEYYASNFHPFDKAGGYGIQDWIGIACIERIEGSYTNVLGLPTQALHRELVKLCDNF